MRRRIDLARRLAAVATTGGDPAPLLELDGRSEAGSSRSALAAHTPWHHGLAAPIRGFLSTETGGATLLVAAIAAALLWSNLPWRSTYDSVWSSVISVDLAGHVIATDLRGAINDGLMTLFFLVVGLEAKRELDMGELRDRQRLTVPVLAGIGGMIASVALYLVVTAGRGGAGGWGVAVSTDTAMALGTLTLVTSGRGTRLRVFMLTLLVVDDLAALLVITVIYPTHVDVTALIVVGVLLALLLGLRWLGLVVRDSRNAGFALFAISVVVGCGLWLALFESGVDPVICGLFIGLLTSAYTPRRVDLEHGTELAQSFREDPTPAAAYSARAGLVAAVSPNERLQYRLHPWTSRLIVPLFALANAGLHLDSQVLSAAARSPITLGIVIAFVAGKPLGILSTAWLTARGAPRTGRLPVSWRDLAGTASSAGIGFTASLLIASRAFAGGLLEQAKVGVLATALISPLLAAVCFAPLRGGASVRETQAADAPWIPDLAVDVDPAHDHVRGRVDAPITLLAYISIGCRSCAAAAPLVTELLTRFSGQVRYVVRHLPLTDVVPNARLAAEAVEAAGAQGGFWAMHDTLAPRYGPATLDVIYRAARDLGLDLNRFFADLGGHVGAARIAADVRGADASHVTGTPTFFIDGRLWSQPLELAALSAALTARLTARETPPDLQAPGGQATPSEAP